MHHICSCVELRTSLHSLIFQFFINTDTALQGFIIITYRGGSNIPTGGERAQIQSRIYTKRPEFEPSITYVIISRFIF